MSRRVKWLGVLAVVLLLTTVALISARLTLHSGRFGAAAPAMPSREVCPEVEAATAALERLLASNAVERLDVRGMTCCQLYNRLKGLPPESRLWMVGENDWLLECAAAAVTMDRLAEDYAALADDVTEHLTSSLPQLVACFAGSLKELMPAFSRLDPDFEAKAQLLCLTESPSLAWLKFDQLDADIVTAMRSEIEKAMGARRQWLKGNVRAAAGEIEAAVGEWAAAAAESPGEPMLAERLFALSANARVFVTVGNYIAAVNCYETMLCVRPDDYVTLVNLGTCLKRLGQDADAAEIFGRAERLRH